MVPVYEVATFPNASRAVTRMPVWAPAVEVAGRPEMPHDDAAAATTWTRAVAVRDEVVVSVAVSEWVPAVLKVAETDFLPPSLGANVTGPGRTAWGSSLVKATVPL